jgi:hypothetical protein
MRFHLLRIASVGVLGAAFAAVPLVGRAQPTPTPAPAPVAGTPDQQGIEVLARGQVHEAYAATAEVPGPSPVVAKQPPDPVEEMPPDERPAGDNVQWIPGYWHWDGDRSDFVWVSGFWRVPPPGQMWVPGSWHQAAGGWQWAAGFWQGSAPPPQQQQVAAQAQIEYLPAPPQSLALAPSVPAPSATYFYVPGTWVWRGRYVWRPGFWHEFRQGWVWVPAHFRWTPVGYVFVEGYWDYPLANRGVLYAPVAFAPGLIARPRFVYTPAYAVPYTSLQTALFVRRGFGAYFFGDYFAAQYVRAGFTPWCGSVRGTTFALNINIGNRASYDPLWSYYRVAHRTDPRWVNTVSGFYSGRYTGSIPRPPHTLVQQKTVVNNITNNAINITNVTNNTTNINKTSVINHSTMVAPITNVSKVTNTKLALQAVPRQERLREQKAAQDYRHVANQRRTAEAKLIAQSPTPRPTPGKVTPPAPQTRPQPQPQTRPQPQPQTRPQPQVHTQPQVQHQPRQIRLDVPKPVAGRPITPAAPARTPPPVPKQIHQQPAHPAPAPRPQPNHPGQRPGKEKEKGERNGRR